MDGATKFKDSLHFKRWTLEYQKQGDFFAFLLSNQYFNTWHATYHMLITPQEFGEFTNWSICLIWWTFISRKETKRCPGVSDFYQGRIGTSREVAAIALVHKTVSAWWLKWVSRRSGRFEIHHGDGDGQVVDEGQILSFRWGLEFETADLSVPFGKRRGRGGILQIQLSHSEDIRCWTQSDAKAL